MAILNETDRLIVTSSTLDNFEAVYELLSDEEVMQFTSSGPRTKEQTMLTLETMIRHQQKHGFSVGDIYLKQTNEFIGRGGIIYLKLNESQPDVEIACVLKKEYWGKGYASELCKSLFAWCFDNLKVDKVVAVLNPRNPRTVNLVASIGMQHAVTRVWQDREYAHYHRYK